MLDRLARRAQRVPAWLRAVILGPPLLLALGVTFGSMFMDLAYRVGPWTALAEWQAGDTGRYSLTLNLLVIFFCSMLPTVVPAGIVVHLLATFVYKEDR